MGANQGRHHVPPAFRSGVMTFEPSASARAREGPRRDAPPGGARGTSWYSPPDGSGLPTPRAPQTPGADGGLRVGGAPDRGPGGGGRDRPQPCAGPDPAGPAQAAGPRGRLSAG